ncbi:MAG: hypothetical protein OEZ41_11930 [Nitrospirota bacterium]|nr:hypothetical protein [Nitrospirota bacterium]
MPKDITMKINYVIVEFHGVFDRLSECVAGDVLKHVLEGDCGSVEMTLGRYLDKVR